MLLTGKEVFIQTTSGRYPLSFSQIRLENSSVAFGVEVDTAELLDMGYAVVQMTERPVGDVVTELTPVKTGDTYTQAWSVREFNSDEINERLNAARMVSKSKIDLLIAEALEKGVPHDFGAPFGVQHVQLRDGDRVNITGLRVSAESDSTFSSVFRSYENNNIQMNATALIAMSKAALEGYVNILGRSWLLKDQLSSAATLADFPEIPESL